MNLQVPPRRNGSVLSICSSIRPSWRGELTAYSKISKSVSVPHPYFAFSLPFFFFTSSKSPFCPLSLSRPWPCCHPPILLRTFPCRSVSNIDVQVSRCSHRTCTGRNYHPASTGKSQPWYCHVGPWVQIQTLEDEQSSFNCDWDCPGACHGSEEQWRELQYQYQRYGYEWCWNGDGWPAEGVIVHPHSKRFEGLESIYCRLCLLYPYLCTQYVHFYDL